MGERNDARRSIEASRARMSVIADELARRSSPDYVRERAREAAMAKAGQVRDRASEVGHRASESRRTLGTLGAILGGLGGVVLAKQMRERHEHETEGYYRGGGFRTGGAWVSREYVAQPAYVPRYGAPDYTTSPEVSAYGAESWSEPYRTEPPYYRSGTAAESWESAEPSRGERLKGKASDIKERASHKASEFKERASHKASDFRERVSEQREHGSERASRLRSQASHLRERVPSGSEMRQSARERPIGVILGGIALGAIAASLLPLSGREQRVMHPAKERARSQLDEQMSNLKHKAEERFHLGGNGSDTSEESFSSTSEGGGFSGSSRFEGGTFTSTTSSSGPTFTSTAGSPSGDTGLGSSEDPGLRSEGDQPYRQPSFEEQLEGGPDSNKLH